MKQAAQPETSQAVKAAEPVRSRPAQPQTVAPGGSLAQLAAMIQNSLPVQQLGRLQDDIQHGPRMQSTAPAVIQAKLENPFAEGPPVNDAGIIQILQEVETYNKIGGYKITFPLAERKQALNQLAKIERLIYAWFDNHKSRDLDASPINMKMKGLMNGVLAERQSLVALSIDKKDPPPVANFDDLPEFLRIQITQIWKALLTEQGIRIEGPEAFRTKILTDFSRLLETEMGRTLTGGIIQTGKGLVIHPTTLATGKFVAKPTQPEYEGLVESEPQEGFVPVDVRHLSESQRLRLLQHVRGANPDKPGMSVTSESGVRHFRFGTGTGSTLPVPADSQDALPHVSSRMADREGNEVIAPTFINLGHELGHVLRSAQGISAAGEGGRVLLEHSFVAPEVTRPEEFFNIGGVENRLRAEAGIGARHGHGNLYSHWAVAGMDSIEEQVREIDRVLLHLDAESEYGIKLKDFRAGLLALQEPFQDLLNGQGRIDPLLEKLGVLNTAVTAAIAHLAELDRSRREARIAFRGGLVNTSSEGNVAIGNYDL